MFNPVPLDGPLHFTDQIATSNWMRDFDKFYRPRMAGKAGGEVERVTGAGLENSLRILVDIHSR